MLKKRTKYIIALVVILILGYNSVYFKSLQEVKAAESVGQFNAEAFTRTFWKEKLMPATENAVEIGKLIGLLQTQKEQTFEKHSHALGIGNLRYFLVKGEGEITDINENVVSLSLENKEKESKATDIQIATEFVYGNAVRDALGLLKINDFNSTMDLNNISEEINKKIRNEVIPPFKAQVKKGSKVAFVGAIELNKKHLNLENIEVIPVELKIVEE